MFSLKSHHFEGGLVSAVPRHQGTLGSAFPLLGLNFSIYKMEKQLDGALRVLWSLMKE